MSALVVGLGMSFAVPSAFAADESTGEAAPVEAPTSDAATLEQIRAAIDTETDPELKQAMEEQLQLLQTGELNLHTLEAEGRAAQGVAPTNISQPGSDVTTAGLPVGAPTSGASGGLVGPPVEIGTGPNPRGGENMPPEVRAQLEKLFQEKGTGEPSKDGAVRQEAERIMREHGITPGEFSQGHEHEGEFSRGGWRDTNGDNLGDNTGSVLDGSGHGSEGQLSERGQGFERAFEQMSPEAREQMERFHDPREGSGQGPELESQSREFDHDTASPEVYREVFERELSDTEPTRETETLERSFEAPAVEREFEAPEQPMLDRPAYESQGSPQP